MQYDESGCYFDRDSLNPEVKPPPHHIGRLILRNLIDRLHFLVDHGILEQEEIMKRLRENGL